MSFKDHFSRRSSEYALFRPSYPASLFAWLAGICPARNVAWDCATGSGQAALGLATHFRRVEATDASEEQIASAANSPGIRFSVARAEASGLGGASVELITVAQALHWFDHDAFFAEAERVLVDEGILAAWTYGLCRVSEAVDQLVLELYRDHLGDFWPPERGHIEARYETIDFPWPRLATPAFRMEAHWTAGHMLGYLSTWSALGRCRRATGRDPLMMMASRLEQAWGDGKRPVVWPLTLLAGRRPPR